MLDLPPMDGNDPECVSFPVDGQSVSLALAAVRHFAARCGLPPDAASRLAIVVEELVANIVEHGAAEGTEISLAVSLRGPEIALTVRDQGDFFDPRRARLPAVMPARGGGVGLALVREWSRIEEYRRTDGRNRLALAIPIDPTERN